MKRRGEAGERESNKKRRKREVERDVEREREEWRESMNSPEATHQGEFEDLG